MILFINSNLVCPTTRLTSSYQIERIFFCTYATELNTNNRGLVRRDQRWLGPLVPGTGFTLSEGSRFMTHSPVNHHEPSCSEPTVHGHLGQWFAYALTCCGIVLRPRASLLIRTCSGITCIVSIAVAVFQEYSFHRDFHLITREIAEALRVPFIFCTCLPPCFTRVYFK